MMKIKYNSIYYPEGEWVDENDNKVEMRKKSFHAKYNGRDIFVIVKEVSVNDGHMTIGPSPVPTFYDAETLGELKSVGYMEPRK
ncbi:hypothetical protein [Providencia rettgeri]|uniref:hypothetical protein n=1 Tax=Providencia rettgeri TaxID=587 RepID=UPI001373FEFB|nr:hypothetical protein [Providencia rettgeri]BBV04001.1 hypothetical protein BML2531_17770 [Providencia rettgeri]